MAQKTLTFVIGDGKVEAEANGFKGGTCETAMKAFEEALGGAVENKKLKADYYAKPEQNRLHVGGKK